MPAAAIIGAVGGIGSALINKKSSENAAQAQADAVKEAAATQAKAASGEGLATLNQTIQDIATSNAEKSQALEKQLTPEVSALKTQSVQDLLAQLQPDQYTEAGKKLLAAQLGGSAGTIDPTLLNAAIAAAQRDLALGGKLDTETQNQVMRAALAKAGGVTPGGLGLGRDISARDLGLTSLQLYNTRLNNATTLGTKQADVQNQIAALKNQDMLRLMQQISILSGLSSADFTKALQASQLGQSIASPSVGLSPTDVANIESGNVNAQSQASLLQGLLNAQQAQSSGTAGTSILGSLTGLGSNSNFLNLFNQSNPVSTYANTTPSEQSIFFAGD